MKKKHPQSLMNKKMAPLKATAAAVIALNSGGVSAVSCPAVISSSTPPAVCTFDGVTGPSVTVINDGTIHGIVMDHHYQPSDSFITVDSGGVITGSDKGIFIQTASSLSGSISNSGSIAGSRLGIEVSGTSTINGGISNSGSIAGGSSGIGVFGHSIVNGGISNSGTISAGFTAGIGIVNATISGGISNSGLISAGVASYGIWANSSIISGGISNSGTINGPEGIRIDHGSSINSGGISNSGAINAPIGIAVNGGSQIDGNISNSGTITAVSGDLGIVVNGSTLTGNIFNSGSIITSVTGTGIKVSQNSTLNGSVSNSGTISAGAEGIKVTHSTVGSISNSGSISAVTGINVVGTSTITGNISNSGTIHGSTHAVQITADSSVRGFDIIGQTARIIGDVLALGTTVNITSGAAFTNEGAFDVHNFNIASGALFHMANFITASGAVDNSGTLSIATGTLQTINGNYTQAAGGVYQIGATNIGNYGQLSASDLVDLSASGAIDVQIQSGFAFHQGDVLSNVLSGGAFTAPTMGYSVTDNSFLWKFTAITNGSNGVDLTIGIDPIANSVCRGSYCEGAATVIIGQVAAGNASFNPYSTVPTAAAFAAAASQATPELTNENLQVTQLVSRTVIDVLPMWSTLRGVSTGDAMLYQPGKVWLKPYGASMTQNQRNTVNGYTASVYGLVAGADVQVADHWMLGGALAAGGDNLRGKSVLSGQSIDSAQYQGLIYTSKLLANNAYFAAQGLLGYGDNDSKRSIPLFASTAKGSYNSWFTDLSAELGWSRAVTDRFVFTPAVNASYLYINQSRFTETGSLMDLSVQENNNSSLVVGAGANVAYQAATFKNQQDLTLTGYAGIAYDLIDSQPSTISTFVAGGPSFSTYGIQYSGAVFRGGLGLTLANPTKPFSVNLNADLQAGNNGYSGIYSATLKYKV